MYPGLKASRQIADGSFYSKCYIRTCQTSGGVKEQDEGLLVEYLTIPSKHTVSAYQYVLYAPLASTSTRYMYNLPKYKPSVGQVSPHLNWN